MNRGTSITKRFVAFVVAFVMMVALVPASVFAADAVTDDELKVYADATEDLGAQLNISFTDVSIDVPVGTTVGELLAAVILPDGADAKVFDTATGNTVKNTNFSTKAGKAGSAEIEADDFLIVLNTVGQSKLIAPYTLATFYTVGDLEDLIAEVGAFIDAPNYEQNYIELDRISLEDALSYAETALDDASTLVADVESKLGDVNSALEVIEEDEESVLEAFEDVKAGIAKIDKNINGIKSTAELLDESEDGESLLATDTYLDCISAYEDFKDNEEPDEVSDLYDEFTSKLSDLGDFADGLTANGGPTVKTLIAALKTLLAKSGGLDEKVGVLNEAIADLEEARGNLCTALVALSAANGALTASYADEYDVLASALETIQYASDLKLLLDEYSDIRTNLDDYEPKAKADAFKDVYDKAVDVANAAPEDRATKAAIAYLVKDLKAAAAAISMKAEIAYAALAELIFSAAPGYTMGNAGDKYFPAQTWAAFKKAYEEGVAALQNEDATGPELDACYKALATAMKDLLAKGYPELLDELIAEVEVLDENDYLEGWDAFAEALDYAKYVAEIEITSYQKAYVELLAAYEALVEDDTDPGDEEIIVEPLDYRVGLVDETITLEVNASGPIAGYFWFVMNQDTGEFPVNCVFTEEPEFEFTPDEIGLYAYAVGAWDGAEYVVYADYAALFIGEEVTIGTNENCVFEGTPVTLEYDATGGAYFWWIIDVNAWGTPDEIVVPMTMTRTPVFVWEDAEPGTYAVIFAATNGDESLYAHDVNGGEPWYIIVVDGVDADEDDEIEAFSVDDADDAEGDIIGIEDDAE